MYKVYLGIKQFCTFYKCYLILFKKNKNTRLDSLHGSPNCSAVAGNTAGMTSLKCYGTPLSLFLISSRNSNHFPFSVVFRLGKSQKSYGAKSGEQEACQTSGVCCPWPAKFGLCGCNEWISPTHCMLKSPLLRWNLLIVCCAIFWIVTQQSLPWLYNKPLLKSVSRFALWMASARVCDWLSTEVQPCLKQLQTLLNPSFAKGQLNLRDGLS